METKSSESKDAREAPEKQLARKWRAKPLGL
jgi:hypothetical protein